MKTYIQRDKDGRVIAEVTTMTEPNHPRQDEKQKGNDQPPEPYPDAPAE